jgi:hypothetical protein
LVTGVRAVPRFTTAGAGQLDDANAPAGTPARPAIDTISPADIVDATFREKFTEDKIVRFIEVN